jgi:hypothetical protein
MTLLHFILLHFLNIIILSLYALSFIYVQCQFRTDSSISFMIFFVIGVMFILTNILFAIGVVHGTRWVLCNYCLLSLKTNQPLIFKFLNFLLFVNFSSGFILMIKLFAAGGSKIGVGLLVMIVTFSFAMIALAGGLLLIKVRQKKCDLNTL